MCVLGSCAIAYVPHFVAERTMQMATMAGKKRAEQSCPSRCVGTSCSCFLVIMAEETIPYTYVNAFAHLLAKSNPKLAAC